MGNSHGSAEGDAKDAAAQDTTMKAKDVQVHNVAAATNRIRKMDSIISRKLRATGARYNMKVVIRGERGVGKTTLWRRLQGLPYDEKYLPTAEIQTTTVNNWVYRASGEVVKVEVWDVVDRGLARGGLGRIGDEGSLEDALAGLPPDKSSARVGRAIAMLDAAVVDVYQGASAVIFMVDPYRPETLAKAVEGLAAAPVGLPSVVLLNFRDKIEEEKAVAEALAAAAAGPAADGTPNREGTVNSTAQAIPASTQALPTSGQADDDRNMGQVEESKEAGERHPRSTDEQATLATKGDRGQDKGDDNAPAPVDDKGGGGAAGPWGQVVTLEDACAAVDRVKKMDVEEGRGAGRRVSIFDCSMKNCFGLRVLYTYLNIPFLELKRQSLLQQAKGVGEALEREASEIDGFIEEHNYLNYLKHLQSADVDPTAGRSAPAAPPGRPFIPDRPPSTPSTPGMPSLERMVSSESFGREKGSKNRKKKHHKDKTKKKDRHHRRSKGRDGEEQEALAEYAGRVTDPKEFAPTTNKDAHDELNDFFGDGSGSDNQERNDGEKVKLALKPSALRTATSVKDDSTDSDEMPVPRSSRLKRVTASSLQVKMKAMKPSASTSADASQDVGKDSISRDGDRAKTTLASSTKYLAPAGGSSLSTMVKATVNCEVPTEHKDVASVHPMNTIDGSRDSIATVAKVRDDEAGGPTSDRANGDARDNNESDHYVPRGQVRTERESSSLPPDSAGDVSQETTASASKVTDVASSSLPDEATASEGPVTGRESLDQPSGFQQEVGDHEAGATEAEDAINEARMDDHAVTSDPTEEEVAGQKRLAYAPPPVANDSNSQGSSGTTCSAEPGVVRERQVTGVTDTEQGDVGEEQDVGETCGVPRENQDVPTEISRKVRKSSDPGSLEPSSARGDSIASGSDDGKSKSIDAVELVTNGAPEQSESKRIGQGIEEGQERIDGTHAGRSGGDETICAPTDSSGRRDDDKTVGEVSSHDGDEEAKLAEDSGQETVGEPARNISSVHSGKETDGPQDSVTDIHADANDKLANDFFGSESASDIEVEKDANHNHDLHLTPDEEDLGDYSMTQGAGKAEDDEKTNHGGGNNASLSPRIIASSLGQADDARHLGFGGSRSSMANSERTKQTELSDAVKAAIRRAEAESSSVRDSTEGRPRREKKKSHKERRRTERDTGAGDDRERDRRSRKGRKRDGEPSHVAVTKRHDHGESGNS